MAHTHTHNAHRSGHRNPLQADPTRTITLRKQFMREMFMRFNRLKREITALVDERDAFGLRSRNRIFNQDPELDRAFAFETTSTQVQEFEAWLATRIDEIILDAGASATEGYWADFVEEGYRKGAGRAFNDARKPFARGFAAAGDDVSDFFKGTREEFLRSAFGQPESIDKIKTLAGRTFTDLKNVTSDMSTKISRELVTGLSQGDNPRVIARKLNKVVEGVGKAKAKQIAQTEIIRAHAEGQLDAIEGMGFKTVTVMVEWSTAGDDRVCPLCEALDGMVLTIREARGLIPRHSSCRCSFLPANVGEEPKNRTQKEIQATLDASVAAELPKGRVIKGVGRRFQDPVTGTFIRKRNRTLAAQKKLSTWPGATKKIAKKRPKPFVV